MYSVKPGRGPALMGCMGGIAVGAFGIIWTVGALRMGAPPFFAAFGVLFVLMALGGAAFNLFNAVSKNRMSTMDITTGREESDPIADSLGHTHRQAPTPATSRQPTRTRRFEGNFCPFCGARAAQGHDYCTNCGKDI